MDSNTQTVWELCVVDHRVDTIAGDAGCVARLFLTCRRLYFADRLVAERWDIRYAWRGFLLVLEELADRARHEYEMNLLDRDLARDEDEGYVTD
jgi:hypothetical protein